MVYEKKIHVLVTPAGSMAGVVTIKALRKARNIRIIAADMNPLASGMFLADKAYLVPPIIKENEFFNKILDIVNQEHIHAIFPCLDPFLKPFAERIEFFNEYNVKIIVSPPKTIDICNDKYMTYMFLKDIVPMPKTFLLEDLLNNHNLTYPLIIKPRYGSGSRNVYVVYDEYELRVLARRVKEPIIQEHVRGDEYTIDVLVSSDNKPLIIVPRKRIETKAGISVKGVIVPSNNLKDIVERIVKKLRFIGPICVQVRGSQCSKVKLIEINPRVCGGMTLTINSIANIPLLALYDALGIDIQDYVKEAINNLNKVRDLPVYLTRFFEDIIVTEKELKNRILVI